MKLIMKCIFFIYIFKYLFIIIMVILIKLFDLMVKEILFIMIFDYMFKIIGCLYNVENFILLIKGFIWVIFVS